LFGARLLVGTVLPQVRRFIVAAIIGSALIVANLGAAY
jgi:hypothetical protein